MILLNTLRMAVDVSFYGALAGFVSVQFGGNGAFIAAMIQCLFFGLSCLGKQNRFLRVLFLLPMVSGWILCKNSIADCVFLIPTAIYIFHLVWKNDYVLELYRQRKVFQISWKTVVIFSTSMTLAGSMENVIRITLPYGVVMVIASILLMRSLRHDPEVYCQKTYQIVNTSAMALIAAVSLVLSSETMQNGYRSACSFLFRKVIQPVLELLLTACMTILGGLFQLLSCLPFVPDLSLSWQSVEITGESAGELLGNYQPGDESGRGFHIFLCALLAVICILVLLGFFRCLNKRSGYLNTTITRTVTSQSVPVKNVKKPELESSSVRKIRNLYRDFLKWYSKHVRKTEPGTTSLDIHKWTEASTDLGETSARIRELYINARYANEADAAQAQEMKELCSEMKKTSRNSR